MLTRMTQLMAEAHVAKYSLNTSLFLLSEADEVLVTPASRVCHFSGEATSNAAFEGRGRKGRKGEVRRPWAG